MKKFISKIGIIFLMAFVIGIGYGVSAKATTDEGVVGTHNLNNTAQNSAKVGDQLKEPEKSWKRYDDTDSRITYNGDSWGLERAKEDFNGVMHVGYSNYKIQFNFKGSKLRLLADKNLNRTNDIITVYIDGKKVGGYNSYGTSQYQILEFEKLNLDNTEHSVIINNDRTNIITLDAIDIDEDGELLTYKYTTLTATADNKKQSITLNWDKVDGATAYNVKRSTTQGKGYETIASNIKDNTYADENVQAGKTYYYIVTPIINDKEVTPSNEASATVEKTSEPSKPDTKPEVKGDATLFITMTNGNIKSYNVSMKTVNKFIEWYEDRASGSNGNSYFKFDKTRNEDEPKTEYIIFDKISSFQVEQNK